MRPRSDPRYDAGVPEFDAPHQQPEQPPPSPEKTARKLPVALLVTLLVSGAAIAVLAWLVWTSFMR
jgi:hypothetical protein